MQIGYLDGDQARRIHINEYDKEKHKNIQCAYGHKIMGKKGVKKSWHYAHVKAMMEECDRNMTEWHYTWQNRVYPDFLEIIIVKNGKKHIADMINGNNVVIEFQKSVIPSETIRERETFYKSMIWIFYCGDMEMKVIKQYGRFMRLKMKSGSKYFLEAQKRSFMDFDKKGLLEVIKCVKKGKVNIEIYVRIWEFSEFDLEFMKGCLKPDVDIRSYREPYSLEVGLDGGSGVGVDVVVEITNKNGYDEIRDDFKKIEHLLQVDKDK